MYCGKVRFSLRNMLMTLTADSKFLFFCILNLMEIFDCENDVIYVTLSIIECCYLCRNRLPHVCLLMIMGPSTESFTLAQ